MVFRRAVEGEITKASKCKIAVYSCPLDIMQTETKVKFDAYNRKVLFVSIDERVKTEITLKVYGFFVCVFLLKK